MVFSYMCISLKLFYGEYNDTSTDALKIIRFHLKKYN